MLAMINVLLSLEGPCAMCFSCRGASILMITSEVFGMRHQFDLARDVAAKIAYMVHDEHISLTWCALE